MRIACVVVASCLWIGCATQPDRPPGDQVFASTNLQLALAFLSREVPSWPQENGCFSCHNNGDAARALYAAQARNIAIPSRALAETTQWLSHPARWDYNQGDPGFSDKCLARIQFAAALVAAREAGVRIPPASIEQAARLVADCQKLDGSWQLGVSEAIGSPVTYGRTLLTWMALRILKAAPSRPFEVEVRKAEAWLRQIPIRTILDAAATLLALRHHPAHQTNLERAGESLGLIRAGQAPQGGWGPYQSSPPEVFDTALVLLALAPYADQPEIRRRIEQGRQYLTSRQDPDGGWPETTRPAGSASYAQRISTTGWAALALLETEGQRPGRDVERD